MAVLIAAVVLLYLLVCVLTVLVIVLYRQFGQVYVGSRRAFEMAGPEVGKPAPTGLRVAGVENDEEHLLLDWQATPAGAGTLLLLGGEFCQACGHLLQHLDESPPSALPDGMRILFVDKPPGLLPTTHLPSPSSGRWQHWRSTDDSVHEAFDVEASPFAIIVDGTGIIRAKGITSSPAALPALLEQAGLDGGTPGPAGPDIPAAHQHVS
jgi:hypothetical protein